MMGVVNTNLPVLASGDNDVSIKFPTTSGTVMVVPDIAFALSPSASVGTRAVVLAGEGNKASGTDSAVLSGGHNQTIGMYSVIAGGGDTSATYGNTAGGDNSGIVSGWSNSTPSVGAFIGAGHNNLASGNYSVVPGGVGNQAIATGAVALGTNASAYVSNMIAHSCGIWSGAGAAQNVVVILRGTSSGSSFPRLSTDGSATPIASNQWILQNNSALFLKYQVLGWDTARTDVCMFWGSVAIRRGATAGTTTLVELEISNNTNLLAGSMTITADTSLGGLNITCGGVSGRNMKWVAVVQGVEIV